MQLLRTVWAWAALWLALVLLSQVVPPIQSPDETQHLAKAYLLSKGQWRGLPPTAGDPLAARGPTGGGMDDNLVGFMFDLRAAATHYGPQSRAQMKERLLGWGATRWTGHEQYVSSQGMDYYLPVIYAPHAVALWAARHLNLSMGHSYLLLKSSVLAACVAVLALAWRLAPFNPLTVVLLALPMALFQMLSPTIDGLCNALTVLVLSAFVALRPQPMVGEVLVPRRPGVEVVLWLGLLVLVGSRLNLLPLLALPLWLAVVRRERRFAWGAALVGLMCLAWAAYAAIHFVDTRSARTNTTAQALLGYLMDPMALPRLLVQTLTDPELLAFYWRSFVGILGWLDMPMTPKAVRWAALALAVAGGLTVWRWWWARRGQLAQGTRAGGGPEVLLLVLVALASLLCIFGLIALTWTPYPALRIEGVQGRYFIAPALIVASVFRSADSPAGPRWWTPRVVALTALLVYVMVTLLVTTVRRFYDIMPLW